MTSFCHEADSNCNIYQYRYRIEIIICIPVVDSCEHVNVSFDATTQNPCYQLCPQYCSPAWTRVVCCTVVTVTLTLTFLLIAIISPRAPLCCKVAASLADSC